MIRAELYKLRHHRTAWLLLAVGCAVAALVAFLNARNDFFVVEELMSTQLSAVGVALSLVAPVYGAWFFGSEVKHDTLKRVLAIEPRRDRVVGAKAMAAAIGLTIGIVLLGAFMVGVSWLAATMQGQSLTFGDGFGMAVTGVVVSIIVNAVLAFTLSLVLRNNLAAVLVTVAVMTVLGALIALIPYVGPWTPFALLQDLLYVFEAGEPGGVFGDAPRSAGTLLAALGGWLGSLAAIGVASLVRRDL